MTNDINQKSNTYRNRALALLNQCDLLRSDIRTACDILAEHFGFSAEERQVLRQGGGYGGELMWLLRNLPIAPSGHGYRRVKDPHGGSDIWLTDIEYNSWCAAEMRREQNR